MSNTFKLNPTILNNFAYSSVYILKTKFQLSNALSNNLTDEEVNELEVKLQKSKESFLQQLNKTFQLKSIEGARGVELENHIEARTRNVDWDHLTFTTFTEPDYNFHTLRNIIDELASIVRGGQWQVTVKRDLQCPVTKDVFCLVGKLDVLPADRSRIYDIKYTTSSDKNKFVNSAQHRLYMYCLNIDKFSYLISDGHNWRREDYNRNLKYDADYLLGLINDFRAFVNTEEEWREAFYKHWKIS